jgi:hypothetical protein
MTPHPPALAKLRPGSSRSNECAGSGGNVSHGRAKGAPAAVLNRTTADGCSDLFWNWDVIHERAEL